MKKTLLVITIFVAIFMIIVNVCPKQVYATETIDNETESQLIQLKESQAKTLEEYQEKYGSEAYGLTAYILHMVQIYSIPFCFLGIVISIMYKVVLGMRHLENAEKGLGMIITMVTITIICQVLPLVFAVVVKLGKE
jgi:hypothetical protein